VVLTETPDLTVVKIPGACASNVTVRAALFPFPFCITSRLRKYQAGALIQLPRLCFLE
jgi:hypothetical protein